MSVPFTSARPGRQRPRPVVGPRAGTPGPTPAVISAMADEPTRRMLADALDQFRVHEARDAVHALHLWRARGADLLVLDLGLAGALASLRELRRTSAVPIMVLTEDARIESLVEGLAAGADDYLVKPVHRLELRARAQAVLRRAGLSSGADSRLVFGDFILDLDRRQVLVGGREVHLTPREFDLIAVLAGDPSAVFGRQRLLEVVFQAGDGRESTVTENVRRLRQKLAAAGSGSRISTVRGIGYRFDP